MTAIGSTMALGVLHPTTLRCEYRADPLGMDVAAPRLSWTLTSKQRGQMQTAYQVLVASSPEALQHDRGDLWDSGKVASDRSVQIAYGGRPLSSRQRAWWKVRVWDQQGNQTLRAGLMQAAHAAARTKTYLCSQYHRLAGRRGKKRVLMAVAHSILVIAYRLIERDPDYRDLGVDYLDRRRLDTTVRHLTARLTQLGYAGVLNPRTAEAV